MKRSGKSSSSGVLNGFLDRGCSLTGELSFEDTLRLDGTFRGKIRSEEELIIGESGDFDGEIDVGRISINGRVKGTVRARERIEIHPRGRVEAKLVTPILVVEEGARVEGQVVMDTKAEARRGPASATDRTKGEHPKVVAMSRHREGE